MSSKKSIAARQAEQARLGETNVSATGVPTGAQHRVRIADEQALLRAIQKKLSGSDELGERNIVTEIESHPTDERVGELANQLVSAISRGGDVGIFSPVRFS